MIPLGIVTVQIVYVGSLLPVTVKTIVADWVSEPLNAALKPVEPQLLLVVVVPSHLIDNASCCFRLVSLTSLNLMQLRERYQGKFLEFFANFVYIQLKF